MEKVDCFLRELGFDPSPKKKRCHLLLHSLVLPCTIYGLYVTEEAKVVLKLVETFAAQRYHRVCRTCTVKSRLFKININVDIYFESATLKIFFLKKQNKEKRHLIYGTKTSWLQPAVRMMKAAQFQLWRPTVPAVTVRFL